MNRQTHSFGPAAACFVAMTGVAAAANAGVIVNPQPPTDASYRVVAYTGQSAPGGGAWTALGFPAMNNTGRVAFVGTVHGLFTQTGIWSEGHTGVGNLQPVVRQFQSVPSLVPMTYGEFQSIFHTPQMSASGDIAFGAPLVGDSLTDDTPTGIVRMVDGQLEVVALPFWPAPGGGLFEGISNLPSINNAGQVSFNSQLIGGGVVAGNDSGLYRFGDTGLELVFREGDAIASLPNGFMGDTTFSLSRINDNGVIGIQNYISDNGQGRWSMWRAEPGGMSLSDLIAWSGAPSPVGPNYGGGLFGFGEISINNAGDAVFVQTAALGTPSETGIWLDDNGVESAIAYWGMGGPLGLVLQNPESFSNTVNGNGRTVFRSTISGLGFQPGDAGIFYRDGAGPAVLVAISGQSAPGMPAGVDFDNGSSFLSATINNQGRIAYSARLTGPGISTDNDRGLWVSRNSAGDADLVLYEGQTLSIGGQLRTVEHFSVPSGSGPESGRRPAFNDNNQVALLVNFTDGTSAIIVATVASLCPGDFNGDGLVNGADLATLLAAWGACAGDFCAADLNFDGVVNGADLASLLAAWGSCP